MKRSIKILAAVILAAMLLACLCPAVSASAAATTLTVTSAEVTAERGETVTVSLVVTENPGFAALRITVKETEGFEVVEVVNGSIMRTMTAIKNILWDNSGNSTKTGILVSITYKIAEDAPLGRNVIDVVLIDCYNYSLNAVACSFAPIVINVKESSVVETVTETQTETQTEAPVVTETVIATETVTDPAVEIFTDPVIETETETETVTDPAVEIFTDPVIETETETETELEAPAGTFVINIDKVSGKRGDTVKVVLRVTQNPGIVALLVTVPTIEGVELVSAENGEILDTMTTGVNILWDGASNSTATGTLVTLTYKITDSAKIGETSTEIKLRFCNNVKGQNVQTVIAPIVIKVEESDSNEQVDPDNTTETTLEANTEEATTPSGGENNAPEEAGCGGCSGEVGIGAIIVTAIIGTAWFFKKKD